MQIVMERICDMSILVTIPNGITKDTFITEDVKEKLKGFGNVEWNNTESQFSTQELSEKIKDIDVCITGWGTKSFDDDVLKNANKLRLIAHTGGSAGNIGTDSVYNRGIKVLTGNSIYAESVAEGVLAYILSSLRDIPLYNKTMHEGGWPSAGFYNKGIFDCTIGLVSFGMTAKYLANMLKPFRVKIKVNSRYLTEEAKQQYEVEYASIEEIFSTCEIISIHSPQTPSTYHMIGKELLEMIPDGALLVNTARGSVIDEAALAEELMKKRFKAALDVYEVEPLPADSKLRGLDNVLLMPHMGGPTVDRRKFVTLSLIEDIKRFIKGEPLQLEISKEYAVNMTK